MINLNIPQKQFIDVTEPFRGYVGGYRAGKTFVGCVRLWMLACRYPGIKLGYFAPTYPHIRDIFYPTIDNILVTPICPHTLSMRPMVIPGDFEVTLEIISGPEKIVLQADGESCCDMSIGEKVLIRRIPGELKLVHFRGHTFFNVLSNKLGWGARNDSGI